MRGGSGKGSGLDGAFRRGDPGGEADGTGESNAVS